jgi:hypothetical protein
MSHRQAHGIDQSTFLWIQSLLMLPPAATSTFCSPTSTKNQHLLIPLRPHRTRARSEAWLPAPKHGPTSPGPFLKMKPKALQVTHQNVINQFFKMERVSHRDLKGWRMTPCQVFWVLFLSPIHARLNTGESCNPVPPQMSWKSKKEVEAGKREVQWTASLQRGPFAHSRLTKCGPSRPAA